MDQLHGYSLLSNRFFNFRTLFIQYFFSKFIKLDPDPHKQLDPDPHLEQQLDPDKMNADQQPCQQTSLLCILYTESVIYLLVISFSVLPARWKRVPACWAKEQASSTPVTFPRPLDYKTRN